MKGNRGERKRGWGKEGKVREKQEGKRPEREVEGWEGKRGIEGRKRRGEVGKPEKRQKP